MADCSLLGSFILLRIFHGRNVAAITGRRESIFPCPDCLSRDTLPKWNPTETVETDSRPHPKNWQNHEWQNHFEEIQNPCLHDSVFMILSEMILSEMILSEMILSNSVV